jgi:hypothetical protein
MVDSDEDRDRSRRLGAEDRGWLSTSRYLVAGRLRGRMTLCAVCTVHKEMRSTGFFVHLGKLPLPTSQLTLSSF